MYIQIVRCACKDVWQSITVRDSATSSSHMFVGQKSITEHWPQIIFDFGHKYFTLWQKTSVSQYIDIYFQNVTIRP